MIEKQWYSGVLQCSSHETFGEVFVAPNVPTSLSSWDIMSLQVTFSVGTKEFSIVTWIENIVLEVLSSLRVLGDVKNSVQICSLLAVFIMLWTRLVQCNNTDTPQFGPYSVHLFENLHNVLEFEKSTWRPITTVGICFTCVGTVHF